MSSPSPQTDPYDALLDKKLHYWRYKHTISIYHFHASYMSLKTFKSDLKPETRYTKTLYGFDPLHHTVVPSGDEVPNKIIEVAYLPAVFSRAGSALGFRIGNNMVEWLCFDGAIDKSYLNKLYIEEGTARLAETSSELDSSDVRKLFDLVAFVEKDTASLKRGTQTEHKRWFGSFVGAKMRASKVRLSWRNFGTDLKRWNGEVVEAEQTLEEWGESESTEWVGYAELLRSENRDGDALKCKDKEDIRELIAQKSLRFASKAAVLGDADTNASLTPQRLLQVHNTL